MVKYYYDVDTESFKRVDNRGNKLKINISEARRIESLLKLGYNPNSIYNKMDFTQKVGISTVRTFVKNLEAGNINLEGDYPAPSIILEEMSIESRIKKLEDDLELFKEKYLTAGCSCDCEEHKNSWRNLWGVL